MSFHWHLNNISSFVGAPHSFNTSQLQHFVASAFQKHSHTVGPLPIVVDFFSKLLPRCGPGTTGNFDMVQTCSNRPGVKFVPRMWKTNPDATIEDLDGKSGPGATSTSDASDMSHLGRCLGTRHVKNKAWRMTHSR